MTTYAKIKNNQVIKYPYTMEDFLKDNPHTKYDKRFTLPEWFLLSDCFVRDNYLLEEVQVESYPSVDLDIYLVTICSLPTLKDGNWVLEWHVNERTDELQVNIIDLSSAGE